MRRISLSTNLFFFMFAAAQALGQPGARRLRAHELVRRLRAVAHRQLGVGVELAGLRHARDEIVDRDPPQRIARRLRLAHVALDHAAVGAADLGDGLAGREVDDLVHVHARIRLAPTEYRK